VYATNILFTFVSVCAFQRVSFVEMVSKIYSFFLLQVWPNLLRWCSPPRQTINTTAPFIKTQSVQSNLLAQIYFI